MPLNFLRRKKPDAGTAPKAQPDAPRLVREGIAFDGLTEEWFRKAYGSLTVFETLSLHVERGDRGVGGTACERRGEPFDVGSDVVEVRLGDLPRCRHARRKNLCPSMVRPGRSI